MRGHEAWLLAKARVQPDIGRQEALGSADLSHSAGCAIVRVCLLLIHLAVHLHQLGH